MHRWLILLLLLGNLAFTTSRPFSQNSVEISDVGAFYTYGEKATFQARLHALSAVTTVSLFIQPTGQPARVEPVTPAEDGGIIFELDLQKSPLSPFALTSYWFRVDLEDGQKYTSPAYSFTYDDNRFQWDTLADSQFQIFWYNRGVAFGQDILNAARSGLKSAQGILPVNLSAPVRIFVYSTTADFQKALLLSGQSWVAGHASPELGTIIVSIPPGPDEIVELERQIPHELAHILQYNLGRDTYNRIPTWFLEGTASLAEVYPNPDYPSVVSNAAAEDSLIPFSQLCGPFPREASAAFLAYAETTSFTRYLHQKYGTSGLGELMKQYQDGVGCQEAPGRALGASLTELEYRWRQELLGMDMSGLVFNNLLPYLALLGLLVGVPLIISLPAARRYRKPQGSQTHGG